MSTRLKRTPANSADLHARQDADGLIMKLTLHTKILGGLGCLVALLILAIFAAYRSTAQLADAASQSQRSQEILTRLESLQSTVTDAETGTRGYGITGNESFLEPYRQAAKDLDAEFAALRDLVTDPAQQQRLAALPSLLTRRMAWLHEVIEARRTLGFTAAQRLIASGRGKAVHDEIRRVIAGLIQSENELLREREERTRVSIGTSRVVIVASGLGVLVLATVMLVIIDRGFAANARARQSLFAANAWQQTILDSASQSIIATDAHGIVQTFNRAAERMLGYDVAEVIGKPAPPLHDAEEVRRRATELSQELGRRIEPGTEVFAAKPRLGSPEEREWTYVRKDGSRFPVRLSVTAMFDSAGQLAGFMGIASDLSERRREEQRFRQVVEAAPNGFIMIDQGGRITLANVRLERLFGYSRAELLGLPIEALVPQRYRDAHPEHRAGFFAAPNARAMGAGRDLFGLHKDGREIPIEIGLSPIDSSEGRFVLASIIDISERKQAEQALKDLNRELRLAMEQAQAADRIKSAFLATMSHELRTPLNSIIGFTGILRQGLAGPLNAEQDKQLGMVQGSARHLLALINDVLDISKIEAGELRISPHPFDLRASIDKVVGIVLPLAEKKGLALKFDPAPDLGQAVSDERRFEQILLNLLGNAIKFTQRGAVTLSAELLADCTLAGRAAGPAVRLQVTDSGMGIKPDDLATLFQPFRQIDGGLARNHEGTGLGLAICRRLADIMGGEIVAASTWGEGSTFSFTLPLRGQAT